MQIGPRYKKARYLDVPVFRKTQTQKYAMRLQRKTPKKGRRGGKSEYGRQMLEKQKARYSYGVSGKQFTTFATLKTNPDLALGNATKMLAREGFHIESTNEKTRVITAYQHVNFSAKTAPLNVIIDPVAGGSKVTLTFVTGAGIYTPESGAESEFCKYMDQIGV